MDPALWVPGASPQGLAEPGSLPEAGAGPGAESVSTTAGVKLGAGTSKCPRGTRQPLPWPELSQWVGAVGLCCGLRGGGCLSQPSAIVQQHEAEALATSPGSVPRPGRLPERQQQAAPGEALPLGQHQGDTDCLGPSLPAQRPGHISPPTDCAVPRGLRRHPQVWLSCSLGRGTWWAAAAMVPCGALGSPQAMEAPGRAPRAHRCRQSGGAATRPVLPQ